MNRLQKLNKLILTFVITLQIFSLNSCFMPPEIYMRDNEYEYNPKKAGAEIAYRITVPSGCYLAYINHHHYLLAENKITVFDLSGDEVVVRNEVTYNIHSIFVDEGDIKYSADPITLFVNDDKIYFKLDICKKQYIGVNSVQYLDRYSPIFSIKTDGSNFMLSDLTADLVEQDSISNIRYDNEKGLLYTAVFNTNVVYDIYRYQYNVETGHFENQIKCAQVGEHQILDFYMTNQYCIASYYECIIPQSWYTNSIYIHLGFQSSYQTVDFTYLHLYNRPLSVISDDDGNIWLYVCEEQNKYELLKLKLIEKEEPGCLPECH